MDQSEILLHLGEENISNSASGSPILYQTSNFLFKNVDEMRTALAHENSIPFYTRGSNPTVQILQKKIAALEHTENSLIFASGSAAIATAVLGNVASGDHVLCVSKPYSWTGKLMNNLLPRFNIETTLTDGIDSEEFLSHVKPNTSLIFLESPNSWTYEMQNIETIAKFARKNNITTIIDNSYASPIYQQPAKYGIDIVVHSATKYLNGHSDLVAGVVCSSHQMIEKLFKSEYMTLGGIISPHDAWLMLRSLRTLPLRMKHISESTQMVVAELEKMGGIERIFYPFSSSFEQKDLAEKYLEGGSGLFTIDLKTKDPDEIKKFCNSLNYFKLGCSWGSYESLAFPAITTASSLNYDNPDIKINRVRLSIGFDEPELLIQDIKNALDSLSQ